MKNLLLQSKVAGEHKDATLKPMPMSVFFENEEEGDVVAIKAWTPDRLDNPYAQQEHPVGYIEIAVDYAHPEDLYVYDINVVDDWRGTGLGQQLYDQAIKAAKGMIIPRLWASNDQTLEAEKAWNYIASRYPVREQGNRKYVDLTDNISGKAASVFDTQTPQFQAWFGDSQVVDKQGRALVVYHGTKCNRERGEAGAPRAYKVRFKDGYEWTAGEDELMTSRKGFYRPDPPKQGKYAALKEIPYHPTKAPGLLTFLAVYVPDGRYGRIDMIDVEPNSRRAGVGKQAVRDFEDWVIAQGGKEVRGEALENSAPFWEALGYHVTKRIHRLNNEEYGCWVRNMKRKIAEEHMNVASKFPTPEGVTYKITKEPGPYPTFAVNAYLDGHQVGGITFAAINSYTKNNEERYEYTQEKGTVRVMNVWVKTELKYHGIGLTLYRMAIEEARKQGYKRFREGFTQSTDAENVWARLAKDYRVVEDERGIKTLELILIPKTPALKVAAEEDTLAKLVWQFREEQEDWYEWLEDKSCFREQCLCLADLLAKFLREHGFPDAHRAGGYYGEGPEKGDTLQVGRHGLHWWVETQDKIIDITCDQFHPGEEDDWRVIITDLNDPEYQRKGTGSAVVPKQAAEAPKVLYHVTFESRVSKILKEGLVPQEVPNFPFEESRGLVFLTVIEGVDYWKDVLSGFIKGTEDKLAVLRINPEGVRLSEDPLGMEETGVPTYATFFIPPQNITWIKESEKIASVEKWEDKNAVAHVGSYRIVVDDPKDAGYITAWTEDNKCVGKLSTKIQQSSGPLKDYLGIGLVEVNPRHRGYGLGKAMYFVLMQYMSPRWKGIKSYLPERYNKKRVPNIWRRLQGYKLPGEEDWMVADRDKVAKIASADDSPDWEEDDTSPTAKMAWQDERFAYWGLQFAVDKAEELIAANPRPTQKAPKAFLEAFVGTAEDDKAEAEGKINLMNVGLNKEHMQEVDIEKPGIVAPLIFKPDKTHAEPQKSYILIDGNHRAKKRLQLGLDFMEVYPLTPEEAWQCMAPYTFPNLLKIYVNPTKKVRKKADGQPARILYVDDMRRPTDPDVAWVKNYNEFVQYLTTHPMPEAISFDHDLALEHYPTYAEEEERYKAGTPPYEQYQEKTGVDCIKWLKANNLIPQRWFVHSANDEGAGIMENMLLEMNPKGYDPSLYKTPHVNEEQEVYGGKIKGGFRVQAARRVNPLLQPSSPWPERSADWSKLAQNGGWISRDGRPLPMTHPYELHGEWAMAENLCGMDDWEVEEQGGEDYLGYAENLAMENGNLRVDRDAGQFSIQARNVTKSRRLITESLLMMPFKGEVTLEMGPHDHPNWSKSFPSTQDAADWLESL